jgi:hypothetical protein
MAVTIDKKQFERHLFEPESSFEILLRGHLWIESLINRILEVHIVDAKALDLDRATFRQKVDIAQAFGFISPQDGAALRVLNRLRNKLAHNLKAEPNDEGIQELVSTLSGPTKAAFDAVMKVPEVIEQSGPQYFPLRYWFFCYATYLDHLCALAKYRKENETKLLQAAAVRVASEMSGGPEITEEEARRKFDLANPPDPSESWR